MGTETVATSPASEGYLQFINRSRTWYNNKRLIALHAWIVLLYVVLDVFVSIFAYLAVLQPYHVLDKRL